jgi:phosphatidylglycerophosphate synthase
MVYPLIARFMIPLRPATGPCLEPESTLAPERTGHKPKGRGVQVNGIATASQPRPASPGRPPEIEEWSNFKVIHPLSRVLVDLLIPTGITPNMISVAGVFVAVAAASSYALLTWPLSAIAGFGLYVVWHVVDGADGDLARRTGRASLTGELVDGICDHLSQLILYGVFGAMAAAQFGAWAWGAAALAGLSHFLQANSYETGRRKYRRWVYGATSVADANKGSIGPLGRLYVRASALVAVNDAAVEAAMAEHLRNSATAARARALYRESHQPVVKARAMLSSNHRTLAGFVSILAGSPLYFFLYEITVLNAAMLGFNARQKDRNKALLAELKAL